MRAAGPDSLGRLLVSRIVSVWEAGKPITLHDLLEILIPYRDVRSALGLTMKGEYDLAILHLLRGGEHLRVEADLAHAVEQALSTPEPDLSFLSALASSRLEVRPEAWARWSGETTPPDTMLQTLAPPARESELFPIDRPAGATHCEESSNGAWADPLPAPRSIERRSSAGSPRRPSTPAREPTRARKTVEGPTEIEGPRRVEGAVSIEGAARPSERCRRCQRILPVRIDLAFCPFCGVGQADRTCAECGERLERGWAYCPRCGKAMGT